MHAEAHRQDHQGEADAEQTVDAAGEEDLDDEPDERHVDDALQPRNAVIAVGLPATLDLCGRHVELLLEDGGADGRERNHHRNDLDLA